MHNPVRVLIAIALGAILSACASAAADSTTRVPTQVASVGSAAPAGTALRATPMGTPRPRTTPNPHPGMDVANAGEIKRDLTYCTAGNVPLKLDIYLPKMTDSKPMPVAAYVHGGGWTAGDKASGEGILDMAELLGRGYLVVSINYRLAPQHKFPAQLEDVKCAIRFLRASAAQYNIDPERIGLWGSSAGAHLASLAAMTTPANGFEGTGGYAEQSSRVQAVVDMFGPADLTREFEGINMRIVHSVFGASTPQDPLLTRASPVTYTSASAAPFLILQGDQDRLVPPNQSMELYDRLKHAGATATLIMVKNAGHGFIPQGSAIDPSRAEISRLIANFFDKYLQ